jgi:RHS repeat-associated protein
MKPRKNSRKSPLDSGYPNTRFDDSSFGEVLGHTGTSAQPYRFAGEHYDPVAGMQYHRARWYDPATGRFAALDPHSGNPSRPATLHKYAYATNDPVANIDPSGLMTLGGLSAGMNIASSLAVNAIRYYAQGWAMDQLGGRLTRAFLSNPTVGNWGGHPGAALLMTALATTCFFNERACLLRGVPTLVNGISMPLTSIHIADALTGFGSNGRASPFVLSHIPAQSRRWLNKTGVCPSPRPAGLWCDEYPYASTLQGGELNWPDTVSVRLVPNLEQREQARVLKKFYKNAKVDAGGLTPTSIFLNLVAPLPTFYIDRKGRKHLL